MPTLVTCFSLDFTFAFIRKCLDGVVSEQGQHTASPCTISTPAKLFGTMSSGSLGSDLDFLKTS